MEAFSSTHISHKIVFKAHMALHIIEKNKRKVCGTLLDGKKIKRRLAEHFQMVKKQIEGLRHTSRW